MTAGKRLGLVEILGDPVRLDEMLADMLSLQALYRRFRRDTPQPVSPASRTPAAAALAPRVETAGLLIRKADGRGGWRHQLVPGTTLFGDDAHALAEGRLSAHPVDAATYAAGLDAAVAAVFGPKTDPLPTPGQVFP